MSTRPFLSGRSTSTCRSNRPARSSAGSRISGRLVAARITIATDRSNPSISASSWLSVCSFSSCPRHRAHAARPPQRVQLVDEDDARRRLPRLLEQVAHPRGADAHEHLDELGAVGGEERHARLAGHRARQQRLAGAGRPHQQDAARDMRAQPGELLRPLQEIDDLVQFVLRLVHAGHVGERRPSRRSPPPAWPSTDRPTAGRRRSRRRARPSSFARRTSRCRRTAAAAGSTTAACRARRRRSRCR